jgi:hypothetical protein
MSVLNILIRLRENADPSSREDLLKNLAEAPGVVSSIMSPRQERVVFVAYRISETNAVDLLAKVEQLGYRADIIGY